MSKQQFVCMCGVVILSASTFAAQTPPQTPGTTGTQPTTTQQDRSKKDKDSVTATGCLRKGDVAQHGSDATPSTATQTTSGTAGMMSATGSRFVLANARVTGGAEQGSPQAPMNNTFTLEAADASVNLAKHLDTRVEVTGKIAGSSTHGTTSAPGQMNQPGNGSMQHSAGQKLKVTSIRMIATTCS